MAFDFSLVSAPFRMQPGLRRIATGTPQLTPARPDGRHLREKLAVLGAYADQALVALPGFDALPALRAIAEEADRAQPVAFAIDQTNGRLRFVAPLLGWSVWADTIDGDGNPDIGRALSAVSSAQRPAALLSLAFEEDFAVLEGAGRTIPWLAVCLPSRWAPETKVGRHFAEVHAPVADNDLLLSAGDALVALVTSGADRWERSVWTISAEPRLHQHPARGEAAWPVGGSNEVVAAASMRSERQTFIPVPGAGQAVFTIHIESLPLSQALPDAEAARRLHDALASMSPAVLAYRHLDEVRAPLLDWLAQQAGEG